MMDVLMINPPWRGEEKRRVQVRRLNRFRQLEDHPLHALPFGFLTPEAENISLGVVWSVEYMPALHAWSRYLGLGISFMRQKKSCLMMRMGMGKVDSQSLGNGSSMENDLIWTHSVPKVPCLVGPIPRYLTQFYTYVSSHFLPSHPLST